jgi:putative OPT family oligopeptide transporter
MLIAISSSGGDTLGMRNNAESADSSSQKHDASRHESFVPASTTMPELTIRAIVLGVILGIIFGASSLYLVLRVGLTVSASIPIAVLSITVFRALGPILGRRATILENNIVQTTGSAGESIAFGVGVTIPALMILGYDMEVVRTMLVAVLGGLLGILMMIPLRRAFIVKQHRRLAYPEGTACADVLIAGEKGGATAKTVFVGFGVAFLYKCAMAAVHLWKDVPEVLLDKVGGKTFFKGGSVSGEVSPELLGVGYIIGTRISCIMVAGGVLAYWVLAPAIRFFGDGWNEPLFPAETTLIREMSLGEIRNHYILYIGAGAVATGGIIAMCRALPMIVASIKAGFRDLADRNGGTRPGAVTSALPRTDRDLSMRFVIAGSIALVLAIWLTTPIHAVIPIIPDLHMNLLGAILIVLFGFLFVTVSSRLTGEIGSSSNPISGMTVATLLMTCLIFLALGWTGEGHRLTALSVAAIVCIAASNGGTTSQDLKTGYLVGGTPRAQQIAILIGALTSALVIGYTLLILNDAATVYSTRDLPAATVSVSGLDQRERPGGTYRDDPNEYWVVHAAAGEYPGVPAGRYLADDTGTIRYLVDPGINGRLHETDTGTAIRKYDAPKAALMSFIIDGILTQKLPWSLVLLGVAIALVMELCGVSSLPFAVGVYLPLSASTPIFVGGMIRWIVDKWTRRGAAEGEMSPGVLLSSGYIAGGAIAGIVIALLALSESAVRNLSILTWLKDPQSSPFMKNLAAVLESNGFALLPFGLLVLLLLLVGSEKLLRSKPV